MKVQVLHIDACPGWVQATGRTRDALDALGFADVPVEQVLLRSAAEAAAFAFGGSPTILVDGRDLFPSAGSLLALACRLYASDSGLAGAPSEAQIRAALAEHVTF